MTIHDLFKKNRLLYDVMLLVVMEAGKTFDFTTALQTRNVARYVASIGGEAVAVDALTRLVAEGLLHQHKTAGGGTLWHIPDHVVSEMCVTSVMACSAEDLHDAPAWLRDEMRTRGML